MKRGLIVAVLIYMVVGWTNSISAEGECSNYKQALMSTLYPKMDEAIENHYGKVMPYTLVKTDVQQMEKEAYFEVSVHVAIQDGNVSHLDEVTIQIHPTSMKQTNYRTISASHTKTQQ